MDRGPKETFFQKRRTKEILDEGERESEKPGLKLNNQKTKIMASGPITSCQIDGETMETVQTFIFFLPLGWCYLHI